MEKLPVPGITLEQAETQLSSWIAADQAVAKGQSYQLDTGEHKRSVTRADAIEIRKNIIYWNRMVDRLSQGGIRIRGVVPV